MAYKREDWNDLLAQVNEVLMNPPAGTDCEELNITPLPLVDPGHKWSAADIQAARSKIIQTCESIQFEELLMFGDKWRAAVVNELQTKLLDAWCNCSDAFVFQPEIIYKTLPLEPYACCSFSYTQDHTDTAGLPGYPHVGRLPPEGKDFNLSDEINGLKVMCQKWGDGSGDSYRYWKAYNSITGDAPQTGPRLNVTGGSAGEIGQFSGYYGYIDRDGKIVCPGFNQNGPQWRRYSSSPLLPVAYCTYWTYYCPTGYQYCQGSREVCVDRLNTLNSLGFTRYEFTLRFTGYDGNPIETVEDCDCDS